MKLRVEIYNINNERIAQKTLIYDLENKECKKHFKNDIEKIPKNEVWAISQEIEEDFEWL